ncbi:GNAT family N-acetyltransferase [Pseudoneobacillus sp. C159]
MSSSSPLVMEYVEEFQGEVVDLILHIQQVEYGIPITKEHQPDLFAIEYFYQNGNGNFWVAVLDGKVIGTIGLLDIENQQVALRKMFVHKDYRGSTYQTASLLLSKAIAWAREKSVHSIYLGTTPQFLAAHRFYEKNGFQQIEVTDLPENFSVLAVDKRFYQYLVK